MERSEKVTFRLPVRLLKMTDELASERECNRSDVIRECIEEYFRNKNKK